MGISYISIFIFYSNFFPKTVYPKFRVLYSFLAFKNYLKMTQSELSDFLDAPVLFHPKAEKDKMEAQVIRYSGEKYLLGLSTLDDIVVGNDEGLTLILENALSKQQNILFITIENEGSTERINRTYHYILYLYGHLING